MCCNCNASELFNNKCILNNNNIKAKDDLLLLIKNGILAGNMDSLIAEVLEENNDLYINTKDVIYQISSSENQKNNKYVNISSIK